MDSLIDMLAESAGKEPAEVGDALGLEAGADAENEDVAEAVLVAAQTKPETEEVEVLPDQLLNELGLDEGSEAKHAIKEVRKLQLDTVGEAVKNKLGLDADASEDDVCNAIDELQEDRQEQDAKSLVEHAVENGKIPPAKKDTVLRIAKKDLEGARDLIQDLPTQVEHAQEREADVEHSGGLTDTQKTIASQLGYTEEEYREKVM